MMNSKFCCPVRSDFPIAILWVVILAGLTCSQNPNQESANVVVANIGDHKIYQKTVERFIDQNLGERNRSIIGTNLIKAQALEHLVRRAIVRDFLVKKGYWVGENAVRLDIESFESQLKRADVSLEDHLREKKTTIEQFEFETGWKLSWDSYLNRVLTEKVLANYFERNRTKFDGTQIKVAQVLVKHGSDTDEACVKKLKGILEQLAAQPLDWSKLVAQHSEAASKDLAGLVGWISIDGPMPPDFTEAAFKLGVGRISPPVKTAIGWHLIKCLEIKPGKKGPQDAHGEVLASAKQELFFKIARDHRKNVAIQFSGSWPHLDESGKLAE